MKKDCFVDGFLPCKCAENCPFEKLCGGAWDYKQPNTKKLMCLCNHLELLAKTLYEEQGDKPRNTLAENAYQLAWLLHNEIADCVKLLQKWNEPLADYSTFLECYEHFKRFYERNGINFLREPYEQLRQIANAHSTVLIQ